MDSLGGPWAGKAIVEVRSAYDAIESNTVLRRLQVLKFGVRERAVPSAASVAVDGKVDVDEPAPVGIR